MQEQRVKNYPLSSTLMNISDQQIDISDHIIVTTNNNNLVFVFARCQ